MYTPPARFIDFDRSAKNKVLKEAWHHRIKRQIEKYKGKKDFPRFLDPLKVDESVTKESVSWSGFPRALDAWLNVDNTPRNMELAHRAAESLDRVVYVYFNGELRVLNFDFDNGIFMAPFIDGAVSRKHAFSYAERPQDEYLEWHVVKDADTGKVIRIDFTAEAPEYWETLAENDPELATTIYEELLKTKVDKDDLIFPGDVYCPEVKLRPDNSVEVVNYVPLAPLFENKSEGEVFLKGRYNPANIWNTELGAVHLTQRNNTLFAEINLAANATKRFKARPDLNTDIDRFKLIACGGYGGVNRNSDPSIGEAINTLVLDGLSVMVSDPIGLYIGSVDLTPFRDPQGNPVNRDEILTVSRGDFSDEDGLPRVLRFSIHPPENATYTLDECTFDGFRLTTGGPIARRTSVIIHGVGMSATSDNPIVECGATLTEDLRRSPKLYKTMTDGQWRRVLPISLPNIPSDDLVMSRSSMTRKSGRRV